MNEWQKTEVPENLPHCRFAHHKSHVTWAELEPEKRRRESGD
jgi:hypothetical protein